MVGSPATSNRSLIETMVPSSGPSAMPGLAPRVRGIRGRARGFGIELREHTFLTGTGGETRKDGFQMIAD